MQLKKKENPLNREKQQLNKKIINKQIKFVDAWLTNH